MPSLPSPRYHKVRVNTDVTKHASIATGEQKEPLLRHKDEEEAWSDITASDPAMVARGLSKRNRRLWSAVMSIRSLLDTVLLFVILGLLLERSWQRPAWFEIGGDITGFAPRISQQITTFVPDPAFVPENGSDFFTDAVRDRWLSIVPKGLGYVRINDTDTHEHNNLPHPLQSYPDSTFTTSVTHQLHCLHAIVEVVAAYSWGQLDMLPTAEEGGAWHLSHCFEYLRQSIMCCGDLALEGQHTTFPPGFTGSDGWDAKHVCRDYGQVLEHLEENRVDDDVWI